MSHRKTLSRLTVASLAAAALAAPAATAMPTDPVATKDPRQADMHASTVKPESAQDRRGEAAADRSGAPLRHPSLAGPPTWPEHPQPIGRAPAPVTGGDGGGGDDVPVPLLIIGGALMLGGMAVTAVRLRTHSVR